MGRGRSASFTCSEQAHVRRAVGCELKRDALSFVRVPVRVRHLQIALYVLLELMQIPAGLMHFICAYNNSFSIGWTREITFCL